jgi:hypothetical protein
VASLDRRFVTVRRSNVAGASDYDLFHCGLLPIGMLVLAFSPVFAARFRSLALPVLWTVVLAMLIGAVRIPGSGLDLYFSATYVAVFQNLA